MPRLYGSIGEKWKNFSESENIAEKNVGYAAVKFKEKIFEILKEDSTTMNIEED